MSEAEMLFDQEQDSMVWNGLRTFSQLPDWLVAARDPDLICDRLSHLVPEFNEASSSCKNAMLAISVIRKTAGQVSITSPHAFRERIPRRQ